MNGKYIIPILYAVFLFFFRHRIRHDFSNLNIESYQEFLFILFLVSALIITTFTFIRNYSAIPVLGVLFCLYLMIEIPAKSWMVFFGWMGLGLSIYLLYGRRKSKLASRPG
jgi:basic amino acid/polyamine antiporter, APA family